VAQPLLARLFVSLPILPLRFLVGKKEFFLQHGVKSVVMSQCNLGCPHEEGEDFPHGQDCPFCPFWKGKQGSNRRD